MMSIIEIDDQTAKELRDAAQALGVSVAELVRLRVLGKTTPVEKADSGDFDFDAELDSLVFSGPTLPASFSRSGIYTDE